MGKLIDLTGQRFGRLTVIERAGNTRGGKPQWLCVCECGNSTVVRGADLKGEKVVSCGCIRRESITKRNSSHSKSESRLYDIWKGMKQRCTNPKHMAFSRYGGKGITVCDEWLHDFQAFYDWAMANGYRADLTIDRIYNDKSYSPDNCRWATRVEQNRNLSTNTMVEIHGESKPLPLWCEMFNINRRLVQSRINRGWIPEEALGLIPRKKS